jgi:hypothetical protein
VTRGAASWLSIATKVFFDRARALWAFPLIFAAGCSSGEAAPHPGAMGRGNGGSGSGPGIGGDSGPPPTATATCPTQPVPRTPLRRLTRLEYKNAVHDLLNVDASAAADLPADEITNSFDNNAAVLTVSELHAEKYVLVSEALAKLAVKDLPGLVGCDVAATGEEACARGFAARLGRRAFRRPTTPADEQSLMAAYDAGRTGGSYAEGIEVMVRAALQSPDFLYRLETTSPANAGATQVPLSAYELATRLSFLVWSSGPDDALLDAAARGELSSKAQVAAKAREMLAQPRARPSTARRSRRWPPNCRRSWSTCCGRVMAP